MNPIAFLVILFMAIDIPMVSYLYETTYANMFTQINKGESISKTRLYIAGAVVYLLMAIGLYTFVISPSVNLAEGTMSTVLKAALLGSLMYGVYDMTNVASIPAFGVKEALIDCAWGGMLFALVTVIYLMF